MSDVSQSNKYKNRIITIPNILSTVRLLLIPLIIWLYLGKQDYPLTGIVVIISALTDIVDGFIARRFNMITDLGKFLDPVADKLTQGAMIICIATKNWWVVFLLVVMLVREILMFLWGYVYFKKHDKVNSSRWYGKLSTVVVFLTMFVLFAFPSLNPVIIGVLIACCGLVVVLSTILYGLFYHRLFKKA